MFEAQALQCEGRSPLYAQLCRRFADDPAVAAIVGEEPAWDAPLRLLGGLHYLVLAGDASWDDPVDAHARFLGDFVREQSVQTNEVQRSWVLLPCFLRAVQLLGVDELDARLLQCFVWAGQDDRFDRLTRAIDVVRANPPELVRGDLARRLPKVLRDRPTLVFQTAVFGYVSPETRDAAHESLARAGTPLAFVTAGNPRDERQGWGMRIVTYPGGEREFVGHADFHGAWLEYSR